MTQISDRDFLRLVRFVREKYGINLEKKRELVVSRLGTELSQRGYDEFGSYLDAAILDPEGALGRRMIERLTTNHTYFFRETACLRHMTETAVPELLRAGAKQLRVWCAAASSGQECYTAAMELDAYLRAFAPRTQYSILATDINGEVLERGRKGVYEQRELENIPERYRGLYLKTLGDGTFVIKEPLRQKIEWERKNLMEPFGFEQPFDLIFCRNVMIYFKPDTKLALTERLHGALKPGCYLYTSTTETIDSSRRLFQYVAPSIYRKGP